MRKFVTALLITSLCLISVHTYASSSKVTTTAAIVEKINVNKATVEQLTLLPGIGEKKAKAIVEYRNKIGKFAHVDDLVEVKGVGDKMLAKIKHQVSVK